MNLTAKTYKELSHPDGTYAGELYETATGQIKWSYMRVHGDTILSPPLATFAQALNYAIDYFCEEQA